MFLYSLDHYLETAIEIYMPVWPDITECEIFLHNYVFVSYCGVNTLIDDWTNLEDLTLDHQSLLLFCSKYYLEVKYLKITGDRAVMWPKWRVSFAIAMKKMNNCICGWQGCIKKIP